MALRIVHPGTAAKGWGLQQKASGRIREVQDAAYSYTVTELECRDGDTGVAGASTSNERCEINLDPAGSHLLEGHDCFYAWAHKRQSGPLLSNGDFAFWMQLHGALGTGGQPQIGMNNPGGGMNVRLWNTVTDSRLADYKIKDKNGAVRPYQVGTWWEFCLRMKTSATPSQGRCTLWCDGVLIFDVTMALLFAVYPQNKKGTTGQPIPLNQRANALKHGMYTNSLSNGAVVVNRNGGMRFSEGSGMSLAEAISHFNNPGWAGATGGVVIPNPPPPPTSSDTTGPSLTVTAPAAGATISAPTAWTATATDPSGVARVEFEANGVTVSDTTSPYAVILDPAAYPGGPLTLTTRAIDTLGNTTTVIRQVLIPAAPTVDDFDLGPLGGPMPFSVAGEDLGPLGGPAAFRIGLGDDMGPLGGPEPFRIGIDVVSPPAPPPSQGRPLWLWELVGFDGTRLGEVPARDRKLVLGRNAAGSASFALDLDEAGRLVKLLRVGGVDLWVSHRGVPRFGGPLTAGDVNLDPERGTVTFGALGIASMLDARFIPAGFEIAAREQAQIVAQLVQLAEDLAGDLGITAGRLDDSIARTKTWDARTSVLSAINELADLEDGFEWRIVPQPGGGSPYRLDVGAPRLGADRGVVLEYGANVSGGQFSVQAEPTALVNEVIVVGAQGVEVTERDEASIAAHRLRQRVLQQGDGDDALLLGAAARAELGRDAWPISYPRLNLLPGGRDASLSAIDVGDIVGVRARRGWLDVDEKRRVAALDVTITDEGAEQISVTTEAIA